MLSKKKLLRKRFFSIWQAKYSALNRPIAQVKELDRIAFSFFRKSAKKRIFSILYNFLTHVALPERDSKIKSQKHHFSSLKTRLFLQWKKILVFKKNNQQKALIFHKLKSRTLYGKMLSKWHFYAHFSKAKRQKTNKIMVWFLKVRKFRVWRKAFEEAVKKREILATFQKNTQKRIKGKILKVLKKNRYYCKRTKRTLGFLKKKGESSLLRLAFQGFREILNQRSERISIEKMATNFWIKPFFDRFRIFYKISKRKELLIKKAAFFEKEFLERTKLKVLVNLTKNALSQKKHRKVRNILINPHSCPDPREFVTKSKAETANHYFFEFEILLIFINVRELQEDSKGEQRNDRDEFSNGSLE